MVIEFINFILSEKNSDQKEQRDFSEISREGNTPSIFKSEPRFALQGLDLVDISSDR
jgi:hypothetical protein